MKLIFRILVLSFILTSCSKSVYYYQLVELESENMKEVEGQVISSNDEIEVMFNIWGDGGNTTFEITNKTNKTIYIKHDECFLIKNGRITDYYDNAEYSSSSSNTRGSSSKRSNIYNSNSNTTLQEYTPLNAIASVLSSESTNESTRTKSVITSDKVTLPLPPNSNRVIYGYSLQNNRYWDCDVDPIPNKKNSNKENGLSFNKDNTPLSFRILITYSFDDDFDNKKTFESSAFLKHFSNWHVDKFFNEENYRQCEDDRYEEYRKVLIDHSPLMYYVKYRRPVSGH